MPDRQLPIFRRPVATAITQAELDSLTDRLDRRTRALDRADALIEEWYGDTTPTTRSDAAQTFTHTLDTTAWHSRPQEAADRPHESAHAAAAPEAGSVDLAHDLIRAGITDYRAGISDDDPRDSNAATAAIANRFDSSGEELSLHGALADVARDAVIHLAEARGEDPLDTWHHVLANRRTTP